MKNEIQPAKPIMFNGVEFTEIDLKCIANRLQEFMRINFWDEPVKEALFSGCCGCGRHGTDDCAHLTSAFKLFDAANMPREFHKHIENNFCTYRPPNVNK